MSREAALFFDSVFMIESLAPGETKTGTALFDGTIAPFTASIADFRVAFRPALGRQEFFAAIEELKTKFARAGHAPILHIEAHGEAEGRGLVLGSGEFVAWEEFRPHLQQVNRDTRFNLLVVMAACRGANLVRSMRPTDRAPFWGVIGPNQDVYDLEMQSSLEAFYRELLTTQDGTDAMMALNAGSIASGGHYKLLDAEIYFCWIYEQHELGSTDEEIEARVNRVVAAWAREHGPDVRATAMIRQDARERVRNHAHWYDHLRRHFLMVDLFPDNASRFGLTYEQCRGAAAI